MTSTDIRVALGLLVALTLAGCSAPAPAESHGSATSENAGSHDSSEAEVVAYPTGFPTEEVPMLDGELLHVAHPGNLWAAWIASTDLEADLDTGIQLLIDAGYQVSIRAEGFAELVNPDRSLRIVAGVDSTYGSCLAYTFTDGAIAAEPESPAEH
jgi:hypothetical protein